MRLSGQLRRGLVFVLVAAIALGGVAVTVEAAVVAK